MDVTPLPIVTLARLAQSANAQSPMDVTLSGMAMLARLSQYRNASRPTEVTLPSSGMTLFLQPTASVLVSVSIRQFPAL